MFDITRSSKKPTHPLFAKTNNTFGLDFANVTIDSTSQDANGFLDCARQALPNASQHCFTKDAVTNLLRAKNIGPANIVGHGASGLIATGAGMPASCSPDKCIRHRQLQSSKNDLIRLRDNSSSLTLWGCYTGSGPIGALFLFEIAGLIDAEVAAPTGLVFCEDHAMWLEPGSTLQTATPSHQPTPIEAPSAKLTVEPTDMVLVTDDGHGLLRVPITELTGALFQQLAFGDRSKQFPATDGQDLLKKVDIARPIQLGGSIAAIITGALTIQLEHQGKYIERIFTIYNHRLLQDQRIPNVYYRTTIEFTEVLDNQFPLL